MSEHTHTKLVEGCYRCDLNRDEIRTPAHQPADVGGELDDLIGKIEQLPDGEELLMDTNGSHCPSSSAGFTTDDLKAIVVLLDQYRKALTQFGVTFADNGLIRMIPREPLCDCGVCNTCLHPWNNYPTTYGETK